MTTSATERVRIVAPGQTYVGKQGITYGAGASAETVGAEKICMNVMPMPPGARAKAHYHNGIETIAYLLEGECSVYYGDDLERRMVVRTGEQVFCPADVPHAPCERKRGAVHLDRGAFLRQRSDRHRAAAGARRQAGGAAGGEGVKPMPATLFLVRAVVAPHLRENSTNGIRPTTCRGRSASSNATRPGASGARWRRACTTRSIASPTRRRATRRLARPNSRNWSPIFPAPGPRASPARATW